MKYYHNLLICPLQELSSLFDRPVARESSHSRARSDQVIQTPMEEPVQDKQNKHEEFFLRMQLSLDEVLKNQRALAQENKAITQENKSYKQAIDAFLAKQNQLVCSNEAASMVRFF